MPARADDGVGHGLHGLILADDALVQDGIELEQLLAFALDQAADRDAGSARHDLGDDVFGDVFAQQGVVVLGLFELSEFGFELWQLAVLEFGRAVEVVVALGAGDF